MTRFLDMLMGIYRRVVITGVAINPPMVRQRSNVEKILPSLLVVGWLIAAMPQGKGKFPPDPDLAILRLEHGFRRRLFVAFPPNSFLR